LKLFQADLKLVPPSIPDRQPKALTGSMSNSKIETVGNEMYDAECLKLINEYFYGVRIFPGQDPTHVYVGWVTTMYHLHSKEFNQDKVRTSGVYIVDDIDDVVEL